MKKSNFLLFGIFIALGASSLAASIDHIQNYSAEYGANPAQQGAINTGSSVFFNPAGLMRLENGTYFVGGAQYAFGKESMTTSDKKYPTDLGSPIPNLALYHKMDESAYFVTMGGVAGGASLEYKEGVPLNSNLDKMLKNTNVKGANNYAQMSIGRSYNLTDKWSASLALRGVFAKRTLKASTDFSDESVSIDAKREAYGLGIQFGLNYARTERLNFGFRYDSQVRLKFKTKTTTEDNTSIKLTDLLISQRFPMYKDGLKTRRDLPAIMALGASYKVTDSWTTFIGGNYYFNKDATMDNLPNVNNNYKNGWEISLGSEYWINSKVAWLVGTNYAYTGAPKDSYTPTEYALNSTTVGTGFKFKQNETTEWTIAYNHYFYKTTTFESIKYKKSISNVGINFVKKF